MILWLITGLAAAVALNRFIFGLGATTNLNDAVPWGFWIGFKLGWVALAAGGFVVAAIFYMLKREEYHPIVKIAILTAFLGYSSFIISLLFDLGLPWNIWHLIIYWNPHSPLFEVGWCVMLYTSVLVLEFLPVPLEKYTRYAKIRNFILKFRFPLVLLGIMLSTLHQSSLGTLFLIMPHRLYPLWYSHIIPIQFFISAVACGLLMLAFETLVLHWLYRRKLKTDIVYKLCSVSVWILGLYFVVNMVNIIASGKLGIMFDGNWLSNLYIVEVLLIAIPIVMFSVPKFCRNIKVQWFGSLMVIIGIVLNRIDIGGFAMFGETSKYVPSWMEVVISFGILAVAALVFLFFIENFHVWDIQPEDPESLPQTKPVFDFSSRAWLGTPNVASITKYSLAFVISFALGMAFMSGKRLHAEGIYNIKVSPATAVDSLADTLCINGNRDNQFVIFPHQAHISRIGKDSCFFCHHLALPGEKISNCWECHTSMYKSVDFFKHDWHAYNKEANLKCGSCHKPGVYKRTKFVKKCTSCHPTYKFTSTEKNSAKEYDILSYTDAMHKLCVSCHVIQAKKIKNKPNLAECSTCHKTRMPEELKESINWDFSVPHFNNVILPDVDTTVLHR